MNMHDAILRLERRLEDIVKLLSQQADEVLDVAGVCRLTGLSKSAVYNKTCSVEGQPPELPHFKKGKRLYFSRAGIESWLTSNRVSSKAEIERDALRYSKAVKPGGRNE
jgi:predicted DNA-binding transcriptional regulator AlpA